MSCPSLLRMALLFTVFWKFFTFCVLVPILIWFFCNLVILHNFMMFFSKRIIRCCLSCEVRTLYFIFRCPVLDRLLHFILRFKSGVFFIILPCFPPCFKSLRIFGQLLSVYSKSLYPKLFHIFLNILFFSFSFNFGHGHSIWNLSFVENFFFSFF